MASWLLWRGLDARGRPLGWLSCAVFLGPIVRSCPLRQESTFPPTGVSPAGNLRQVGSSTWPAPPFSAPAMSAQIKTNVSDKNHLLLGKETIQKGKGTAGEGGGDPGWTAGLQASREPGD